MKFFMFGFYIFVFSSNLTTFWHSYNVAKDIFAAIATTEFVDPLVYPAIDLSVMGNDRDFMTAESFSSRPNNSIESSKSH